MTTEIPPIQTGEPPATLGRGSKLGTSLDFRRSLDRFLKKRVPASPKKLGWAPRGFVAALLCAASLTVTAAPTRGVASWYGEEHRGRIMANGAPFDPDKLTCASWFHRLGTKLTVRSGGRVVRVTVTDRGPRRDLVEQGRIIDLSLAAFRRLGAPSQGLIRVTVAQ